MCKVISVCNQKGGVAKTTTVVNLGVGLAREGFRVLCIDNDAQGSLTASLGYKEPNSIRYTLATVMDRIMDDEEYDPAEGILHHQEGVDIMPANYKLSAMELKMTGEVMGREYILKDYIEAVKDRYDWIITDCAPTLSILTINALSAADSVLIPVQTSFLSIKGLEQLIRKTIMKMVTHKINPDLRIEGILFTLVDGRTNYSKEIISAIEENYGGRVKIFEKPIPQSVRVAECSSEGVSIYKYDPKGKAALGYESLTREIMENARIGGDHR